MKAKTKNMIMNVAVLCAIALASGLILGIMNKITYVDPEREVLDNFAKFGGTDAEFEMIDRDKGQMYYFARSKDETPVYAIYAGGNGGYGGEVRLYVFVREGVIEKIVPGENSETFMDKLEEKNFFGNYIGRPLASVTVSTADVVSGATKSSAAVKNALKNAQQYYKGYLALQGEGGEQ